MIPIGKQGLNLANGGFFRKASRQEKPSREDDAKRHATGYPATGAMPRLRERRDCA